MPRRLVSLVRIGTGGASIPRGNSQARRFSSTGRAVAETFKYLSPRQYQQLDAPERDRYLAALYEHLHLTPHQKQRVEVLPERKDGGRKRPSLLAR